MKIQRVKPGFTLMELLVVIATISILAALLLPVLARGNARAKSAVCESNLRQMGFALRMYLGDFNRYPGCWIVRHGRTGYDEPPNIYVWPGRLQPYLANAKGVFGCPSAAFSAAALPDEFSGMTESAVLDYAYNSLGAAWPEMTRRLGLGYSNSIPETKVKVPSDMVAISDGASGHVWPPYPAPTEPPQPETNEVFSISARHYGGGNALLCDSHVEHAKINDWTKAEDQARRRWNIDHEPHPEFW